MSRRTSASSCSHCFVFRSHGSSETLPASLSSSARSIFAWAAGVPVADLCRKVGVPEQGFYRWKKVSGGLQPSEARELKQLREESAKLERLVADLSLDKVML